MAKETEINNTPYEIEKLQQAGISVGQLPRLVEQMFNANQNLFVWGFMGIGKTQMIEQFVARKRESNKDFGYYYFPLASMLPEDLTGIPMPYQDKETGYNRTAYAVPKTLPTDENGEGLLVFDEFNNASPSVQNACQQLIQERRIGDYHLPKGYRIIAMGNQSGVNAYSNEIQAPVKDRFGHIFVSSNAENWADYILGLSEIEKDTRPFMSNITPDQIKTLTCAFVKRHPDLLFDENEYNKNSYTFATPRSWERFIKLYSQNLTATKTDVKRFASIYLGIDIASAVIDYFENSNKYQDPYEILVDKKDFRDTQDLNGYMGTLTGCISVLVQHPDKDQARNLVNAGLKLKKSEWLTILGKMILQKAQLKPLVDKDLINQLAEKIAKKNSQVQ